MAKTTRGNNIKKLGWRGTCPLCSRTGVKLLWTGKTEDGKELKTCKVCNKKK